MTIDRHILIVRHATAAQNRSNASWLRTQLAALEAELLRREVYEDRQLTVGELRAAHAAIREGRTWR